MAVHAETNKPDTNQFAAPKTDTEIIEARKLAIPPPPPSKKQQQQQTAKTQQDTAYCIRLFRNQCHGSSVLTW